MQCSVLTGKCWVFHVVQRLRKDTTGAQRVQGGQWMEKKMERREINTNRL